MGTQGASPAQVRAAERGFKVMLRRRFSAAWIAENAADLMAQANVEYAEWLEENAPARNPVGWLLTCAYRRAQNLLDRETRRPASSSLDSVLHVADEATPTPEQQALDGEREERLRAALAHLPEKECKLLALVYYGDLSVREAGRKLGWGKSAADRHHRAALAKLQALVGERNLLSPAHLGWGAWAIAYGERHRLSAAIDTALTPLREAGARAGEAAGRIVRQAADAGRRLGPAAEHAPAAASGGGGRLIGACGVATASVVCGLATGGIVPIGGIAVHAATRAGKDRPVAEVQRPASDLELNAPQLPVPETSSAAAEEAPPAPTAPRTTAKAEAKAKAPVASTKQTIEEFGVEGGAVAASEASAPESSGSSGGSSSGSSAASSSSAGSKPTPPGVEFGP